MCACVYVCVCVCGFRVDGANRLMELMLEMPFAPPPSHTDANTHPQIHTHIQTNTHTRTHMQPQTHYTPREMRGSVVTAWC